MKLKYVNINLAYSPKPYYAMSRLHERVIRSSGHGLSPEDMLSQTVEALREEGSKLILAVDEVDTS